MKYINRNIIKRIYKKRNKNTHKGDYGKVLCIGGSEDFAGAPYLATNAALSVLRSGTDIVTVAAPENIAYAINSLSPDIISKKINCRFFTQKESEEILKLTELYDVILIGPGIGQKKDTFLFINEIVKKIQKPLVVDADAIKAVKIQDLKNAIVTPHERELEIILKNSKIVIENKEQLQEHLNTNVFLIKNHIDTIVSELEIKYNKTGNPGMCVGGTGDILSGIVSGLLSQGNSLIDSASASAYLCGYIGDKLFKNSSYSFIASDFISEIGPTIKELSI